MLQCVLCIRLIISNTEPITQLMIYKHLMLRYLREVDTGLVSIENDLQELI